MLPDWVAKYGVRSASVDSIGSPRGVNVMAFSGPPLPENVSVSLYSKTFGCPLPFVTSSTEKSASQAIENGILRA